MHDAPPLPPWDEPARLRALERSGLLDSPRERVFDDIVELAAHICATPIAAINLIAAERQWSKAAVGSDTGDLPRALSICALTLHRPGLTVIDDLRGDPRCAANPLVQVSPGLHFYAGVPLCTPAGLPLGTLCVFDRQPRAGGLSAPQGFALAALARQAESQIALRLARHEAAALSRSLRDSESRNRQILASALDYAIIATDLDGLVTSWSSGAEQVLGWSEAEMLGRPADVFFDREDRAAGVPAFELHSALNGGRASYERWCQRRNGARFWATSEIVPLQDGAGAACGFLKILRDRTREQSASKALRTSEERLQFALDAVGLVGTWDWDVTNDRVFADARFARFHNVDPARAAQGVPIAEFTRGVHPDDVDRVVGGIAKAVDEGSDFGLEYRLRGPGGELRWLFARGRAYRDDDGGTVRFPGLAIDITERKRAEQRQAALAELADRLRDCGNVVGIVGIAAEILGRSLNGSRAGLASVAADGEHVTIEADWTDGHTPSVAGSHALATFGPYLGSSLRYGATVAIDDVLSDPHTAANAAAFMRLPLRALLNVPLLEHGRLAAIFYIHCAQPRVWSGDDIELLHQIADRTWSAAERARAEAALRRLNETLESEIEVRTRELEQTAEALRQAQKMEAIGQLTGGIAHDFNNLLAGIGGGLELIARAQATGQHDAIARYVELAKNSTQRATALTQRLLAFGRIQSLDIEATAINTLIRSMEDLLRRSIDKTITLDCRLQDPLWPAVTDANQFESALLNLVINARDAMPEGGRLSIATNNVELDASHRYDGLQAGAYVEIRVGDTGGGMSPTVLAKAFEPFFTTKPVGQGTGLGLSMIYGFAKQTGGHVHIDSEPGRGTTVTLLLPRAWTPAPAPAAAPASAAPGAEPGAEPGETVLVVEDDGSVRLLVLEVLAALGYNAIEADCASAALPLIEGSARLDLLITDVGLPGMNGRQLAELARAARPGLKVLFMTGYAQGGALRDGVLDPGMEMIAKPFGLDTLAQRIRDIIGAAASTPPASAATPAPDTPARPARILIVDDNTDAAEALRLLAGMKGYSARCAFNGAETLALAREFQPDIYLIDIRLPDMSGHELARRLRAQPGGAGALMLALSGLGHSRDREESLAAGFQRHLVKPVNIDELFTLLAEAGAAPGRTGPGPA